MFFWQQHTSSKSIHTVDCLPHGCMSVQKVRTKARLAKLSVPVRFSAGGLEVTSQDADPKTIAFPLQNDQGWTVLGSQNEETHIPVGPDLARSPTSNNTMMGFEKATEGERE